MSWSILIVDDSALVRSQLRGLLEPKGVRVIEAQDGSEGLWRARESQVDLVLTDIHMPRMDGIRMIEELRKLPQYAVTPIFVLTSDASNLRAQDGKRAGANAWILKPLMPELLWNAIEKALGGVTSGAPKSVSAKPNRSD
jgi:two-component system, chemotaxis family, chemotaxis protein CheY